MTSGNLLDDQAKIALLDTKGMLGIVESAPKLMEWCLKQYELDKTTNIEKSILKFIPKKTSGIFISGMGGSAISGDVLRDWIYNDIRVPVIVNREYTLPACINNTWIGFILSYSGNTEETLSSYLDAKNRGIKCICVTSGGLLEEISKKTGDICLKVPGGLQPRAAMPYLFFTLAIAVANCQLVDKHAMISDLHECIAILTKLSKMFDRTVPVENNPAKQHAIKVHGTTVLIYGFDFYQAAARRFKGQVNENGKNPAYYDVFSELNHNETVGWEVASDVARHFSCFFIRDPANEPPTISVRIEFTKHIVAAKAHAIIDLEPMGGTSRLARMLSIIYLADFISVYLAFLNGADPTPVKYIQGLKDELEKKVNLQAEIVRKIAKITKH